MNISRHTIAFCTFWQTYIFIQIFPLILSHPISFIRIHCWLLPLLWCDSLHLFNLTNHFHTMEVEQIFVNHDNFRRREEKWKERNISNVNMETTLVKRRSLSCTYVTFSGCAILQDKAARLESIFRKWNNGFNPATVPLESRRNCLSLSLSISVRAIFLRRFYASFRAHWFS